MSNRKRIFIATFGCRLNQADEALIYGRFAKYGYEAAGEDERKDLIIVNTCTVTNSASQKSRQALRRLRRENPDAKIAVTGCDVEINEAFWHAESACNFVIKGSKKDRIEDILDESSLSAKIANGELFEERAPALFPFKSRALVKIQEGCDAFCAYCIVPFARGKPRSRSSQEIIEECKRLLDRSYSEIILTGVNICRYNDKGRKLSDLVSEILNLGRGFRLRLSSTELDLQLYDIIRLMEGNENLCRFLHLPLQHGSDEILRAMRRQHSTEDFAKFAKFAAEKIRGIHIGTDLICGLPGENDNLFRKSYDFVNKLPLANIHIFRYSSRKGTDAAKFADRPAACEIRNRMKLSKELKAKLSAIFLRSQIGAKANFIGEKTNKNGSLTGWSDNYINTTVGSCSEKGKLLKIKFRGIGCGQSLSAERIC